MARARGGRIEVAVVLLLEVVHACEQVFSHVQHDARLCGLKALLCAKDPQVRHRDHKLVLLKEEGVLVEGLLL